MEWLTPEILIQGLTALIMGFVAVYARAVSRAIYEIKSDMKEDRKTLVRHITDYSIHRTHTNA